VRDYAKLAPTLWTGETGNALRARGFEGLLVATYLVSSPMSNMLGLFAQPLLYMAHETGLGIDGARKGLQDCIEVGFCKYDERSQFVFVHEMAKWQISEALKPNDLRCKGIQKDYDALPTNAFLGEWFDRYAEAFNLTNRRSPSEGAYQAPSKPGAGTGAGTGETPPASPGPPPPTTPKPSKKPASPKASKCPTEFAVTADMRNAMRAECPHVDIDAETRLFRDHEFARARSDWPGTWRNWIRRAAKDAQPHRGGAPPPNGQHRQSATERGMATVAGLTGRRPTAAPHPHHDPRPEPPPADIVDVPARAVG
jgi:hypothetical protein